MAKLNRYTSIVFASSASGTDVEQFGSTQQLGSPNYTNNPSVIQALSAWTAGWSAAIVTANKAPYKQDVNAVDYVFSYFISYLFQEGIPEWDAGTTYFLNSIVKLAGTTQLFGSLQDNNINNLPPNGASNASWQFLNPPVPNIPTVGNALKASLVVSNDGGSPNVKVDIAASLLSVQGVVLTNVNLVANISVNGANGLDTGTVASNTWYAVFVICSADGSLSASLLSLSSSAPTMPGGYTLFRRVGWVRVNGSTNISRFVQAGDWTYWTDATQFAQGTPSGTINYRNFGVAPTAVAAQFSASGYGGTGGALFMKVTGTPMAPVEVANFNTIGGNSPGGCDVFNFPLNASQQADGSTAGSFSVGNFVTMGYYDPV